MNRDFKNNNNKKTTLTCPQPGAVQTKGRSSPILDQLLPVLLLKTIQKEQL